MKKLLLLPALLLLIAGSFYVGRFTAPAPRFEASDSVTDKPLDAAFETFIQAQRDTLALYKTHENFDPLTPRPNRQNKFDPMANNTREI